MSFLYYPFLLLLFWYVELPLKLLLLFGNLNGYVLNELSIPLFLKTFFKPAKFEYREGLILFSIVLGIAFKSVLIVAGLFLFAIVLVVEVIFFFFVLLYPLIPFYLLLR